MASNHTEPVETTPQAIEESQIKPVAGIWACNNCGLRIQVITESDVAKVQAFVCVCGTPMEPGEEHAVVGPDLQKEVVDD